MAAVLLTLAPAYAQKPFNLPDEVVDQSGLQLFARNSPTSATLIC